MIHPYAAEVHPFDGPPNGLTEDISKALPIHWGPTDEDLGHQKILVTQNEWINRRSIK